MPPIQVINEHSVIMFRYPLTAPIEIFNMAQVSLSENWPLEIDQVESIFPIAKSFRDVQPIKTIRVQDSFLHDILNRFVSLYARVGSPDFTQITIDKMSEELRSK